MIEADDDKLTVFAFHRKWRIALVADEKASMRAGKMSLNLRRNTKTTKGNMKAIR
jgi:hypothetical protein